MVNPIDRALREVQDTARNALGFELRAGQLEAVQSVLERRDTLAVMPSGSGKSAIYQVAGLLTAGATVVVSPLIALQQDQLEDMADDAAALNSGRPARERRETLERFTQGGLEFLLLAPEQLANEGRLAQLASAAPSLLVVDEAHCISEWGHDFRPEYLQLGAAAEALGHPTILALTATASKPVREEIVERLGLRDPLVLVRGFDRPNLRLSVDAFYDADVKRAALLDAVVRATKPGIVYAATRGTAEEVARQLAARGVRAAPYHAGLPGRKRAETQGRFMDDALDVIVATTAFGMGVDKPNVRFVFHHDVAGSLDAYYQEIGRGGRDGELAEARLFYRPQDLGLRRFFAGGPADERHRAFERSRVDMMRGYSETRDCRREFLLNYFGEGFDAPCGNCDTCEAGTFAADPALVPFALGVRVRHAKWGEGEVQRYEGDRMVVLFREAGYKTLAVHLVVQSDLLSPV